MSSSSHSPKSIESEVKSLKTLLKEVSQAVQLISFRQLENENKINELAKAQEEKSQKSQKSKKTHASHSQSIESLGEGSRRINDYYQPPPRRTRQREQEVPRETRVDLPHFHGKENVEVYLDWEMKVEQLFACHRVSEDRKVPLATLSFQGNAMYWWTSLERDRRLHREPSITYWNDLRGALRRRHIPSYYHRELMDKLQRLQQRNMSVEEYRQKMELYMMRASIREEEETTIARFLSGLSLEIRDRVELLPYQDLNDLVQLCIKVEQQNLRKTSSQKVSPYSSFYPKKEFRREGSTSKEKPKEPTKPSPKKPQPHPSELEMSSVLSAMVGGMCKHNVQTKGLCF
ncbi:uncharacterized protein [Phaseolus vulgaris]|uniref:uncharacterized protein n=1 Tax=Phaseolus vulgaris TaxID=3885 RepID=UPI0035C9D23C